MDKALGDESGGNFAKSSRRRLANKTALSLTAQKIIRNSKFQRGHSL